ncbi:PIN domain-containing protein [Mycobacterium sp.]|uniref:PIN domain-containing protein n=1 Tax=Mycobacterium sp. TaxID=1785 RepID=UPI0039C9BA7F
MTYAQSSGVVVDTMVISWLFSDRPNLLAGRCRKLIGPQPVLLAFQTVMELRYGILRAGWGQLRRRRFEHRIAELAVIRPDDEMITTCANLRVRCAQIGHALGNKLHDGDRWIATAAMRLGVPLVSRDGVFNGVPGLDLITLLATSSNLYPVRSESLRPKHS